MTNLFINHTPKTNHEDDLKKWSDRLERPSLDSVYISALDDESTVPEILELVEKIKEYFQTSENETEISLECNPNGLSLIYLRSLYAGGVTRLSMARANCDHLIEGFSFFDSVNVDGRLFEGAQHISRYDLREFEQFEQARLALATNKFFPYDRYHFCQPGAVCQYLKNVLEYRPYIGVGVNAHSRFKEGDQWLAIVDGQEKILSEHEFLEEFLLQNFSLYPGVDRTWFEQETGRVLQECFDPDQWQTWIDTNQIDFVGNRTHLTGEMFFTPEKIIAELKI